MNISIERVLVPSRPGEPEILAQLSKTRSGNAKLVASVVSENFPIQKPTYKTLAGLTGLTFSAVNQALRDGRRCPDVNLQYPIDAEGRMWLTAESNPDAQRSWETKRANFVEAEAATVRETDREAVIQLGYSPAVVAIQVPDALAIMPAPDDNIAA